MAKQSKTKDEDEGDLLVKAIDEREGEDAEEREGGEVEPLAVSDVAPGFTPNATTVAAWTAAAPYGLAGIKLDTATYSTETPPRQTPPTSIENAMKHSPPHFHDSNGAVIASVAPTLSGISPATAVSVTGADLTTTATGTNFNRATFLTFDGAIASQTAFVSATSLTCLIKPSLQSGPKVVVVKAKNPAGESTGQNFTFT